MRIAQTVLILFGSLGCSPLIGSADETVFSGPQAGERLPALKVRLAYTGEASRVVDLVDRSKARPTLLVIVSGSNRPAARLTRALMNFAEMRRETLFAAVVYLHDDQTAALEQLKRASSWWQVGVPVGVSVDGAEGPGSFGLNRKVNLTVLVANQGRVVSNFALIQPSETDAPRILRDVVALAGGRVPTIAEVMFLSVPTYKPDGARWSTAPTDVRLRELICGALAAENKDSVGSAVTAIEQYVGDDKDRQRALGRAAGALRQGRTRVRNKPIVKYLKQWHEKYDDA